MTYVCNRIGNRYAMRGRQLAARGVSSLAAAKRGDNMRHV